MAKILVIDDDDDLRDVLCEALAEQGHEVHAASDGLKGVTLLETLRVDLVVTDILMPRKEGIETIRDLRRLTPAVKIVAMSGGGRSKQLMFLKVAEDFGADVTLQKPFRLGEFLAVVERLLAG